MSGISSFVFVVITHVGYKYEQLLYTLRMHCDRPVWVVPVMSFVLHPAFHKCQQFLNALSVQLRSTDVCNYCSRPCYFQAQASPRYIEYAIVVFKFPVILVSRFGVYNCLQFLYTLNPKVR